MRCKIFAGLQNASRIACETWLLQVLWLAAPRTTAIYNSVVSGMCTYSLVLVRVVRGCVLCVAVFSFNMAQFGDLKAAAGLTALNTYLLTRSYIDGFKPTQADVAVYAQLSTIIDEQKYQNVARWAKHIGSFSSCKRN